MRNSIYRRMSIDDIEDRVFWLNSGSSYEKNVKKRDDICLTKHGLHIPKDSGSYEEFVCKIQTSEADFFKKVLYE